MSSIGPSPSLSPSSAPDSRHAHPQRKRNAQGGGERSATRRRTQEPPSQADNDDGGDDNENGNGNGGNGDDRLDIDLQVYDPDQTLEERRKVQTGMRNWQRSMRENPDEYVADDSRLLEFLKESTKALSNVRQTGEAAIDARGLVTAADLSTKRVQKLLTGGVANGIDVDEFASKVITFMLRGEGIEDDEALELSSTQRWRRQGRDTRGRDEDEDDEDGDDMRDEGDMFNWAHYGRYACIPSIRRPALSGFLLGPLSVSKKTRKIAARSAPLRIDNLEEVRPEILDVNKLKRDKEDDLVTTARHIHRLLKALQEEAQESAEKDIDEIEQHRELDEQEMDAIMEKYALRNTGGIDLIKFVVNPHSFGQTVENIFYVSFLIREGTAKLEYDKHGLPTLAPQDVEKDPNVKPDRSVKRNQAFMSIDMRTWKDMIQAFNITEPLIPHRQEQAQHGISAGQWYS
ncbi:Nse4-domain-containing protein [Thozetella sp. PMI_491]|nr:Nse4-domain-containing protein [Thozetella sp. PMI_491]